jgi:hypothetical protein
LPFHLARSILLSVQPKAKLGWKSAAVLIGASVMVLTSDVTAGVPVVAKAQPAEQWMRSVIPLPKEASIAQEVTLPAADVKLTLRSGAGDLEQGALGELQSLFRKKAGVSHNSGKAFEIILGVCDARGRMGKVHVPDAARLKELPNREQAYLIRSVGANKLVLAALDARGVFYAALTLRQMLEGKFKGDDVTIPLATITDWPDLAERGLWGGSATRDVEWMAERKMNLVEFHTDHSVDAQGKCVTGISQSLLRRGQLNGVKMVPIISHINHLGTRGVFVAYPELRGKGKGAVYQEAGFEAYASCASEPKLREILAGWMTGYASQGNVREISCWLGELIQRCECENCRESSQFVLEARAFVEAWRLARQQSPDLRIRILLTQGSYAVNDKVLAEIPPEVGVTYYDGGRTYDSSPQPMIYPLLKEYAVAGHWLGCYPQLTPSWRIVSPWSCPQFVKFRMTEFVDKKLTSLAGYVVPDNRLFDFNVTAAAEWSWNAHGRSEREFALAWARRKGFNNPNAVADWAVMLGPVAWDLYGARFVERYLFKPASVAALVTARSKLQFGKGMLTLIRDEAHLRRNRQTCAEALRLATQSGSPAIVAESTAILTYYDMLTEVCGLCETLSAHGEVGLTERRALQDGMNRLALAARLNAEALRDWERAVEVGAGLERFRDGVAATEGTAQAVAAALKQHGVRNTAGMFTNHDIGWQSRVLAVEPYSDAEMSEAAKLEQQEWVNHLLPLPHEIAIPKSVTLKPGEVGVVIKTNAGPVHQQIQAELATLFKERAGQAPTGTAFQIIFGVLDDQGRVEGHAASDAARLKSCPNPTQAYLIRPEGDHRLVVAALNERGLYYGAQTLRQLLEARFTADTITIPLATITDWPDLEERGSWNSARVVPFLSALKLNFLTYTCGSSMGSNGWPLPVLDPEAMGLLRRHAMVERVQMLHHLNYFDRIYGLYKLYPELKGQGDAAIVKGEAYKVAQRDIAVICASQPRWKTILTEMLEALGEQGAPEVSVWLSEFAGHCQCAECRKSTQVQLESKLVAAAWQEARKQYPDLKLRIFYSQGDASPATVQALADLPPEVRIERVYGLAQPFRDAARQGKWVLSFDGEYGCMFFSPDNGFRSPDGIIGPITNGYVVGLKGVLSMSAAYFGNGTFPAGYYPVVYAYPLSALAEWSWNVHGRTPRQFMEAWATRAGHQQPARFADWVEAISAVKMALAHPHAPGAGLPTTVGFKNQFATIAECIRERKPIGLFGASELVVATAHCQKALALAEPLNKPEPATETRYFVALLTMYERLNVLSESITGLAPSQPTGKSKVQEAWTAYQEAVDAALVANAKRIELWRTEPADYVESAQQEIRGQWLKVQKAMGEAIAELLKAAQVENSERK